MDGPRFELHWIDYAIVVAYFAGVVAHGLHASRRQERTTEGYFLAGRALPWYLIGISLYASNMSGASFVGLIGGTYDNGLVVFNYEWTAAAVLVFFAIFMLPSFLRSGLYTVPEFLEHRYDARSRRAFSLFTVLAIMFIDTAGALYAGGMVITLAMPFVELWQAVAVLALIAGLYTILGGLAAVVVTDAVQAILLMAGAAVIFVVGLREVGGWTALMDGLEPAQTELIKPLGDDFLPWPGLLGVILLGFYYWTLNQFIVQRALAARNLDQGRKGAIFAGFLKLPNLFLMIVPGLIALALYPDLERPDLAFPALAFDLLPLGLRGLVAAALIAAIMSSLDSALNAAGTLVTMDFVKPWRPATSEAALVATGRTVTGLAMVVGAVYAPLLSGFPSLFEYFQASLSYVVPPIVVVYLLGLFWRRGTAAAAFWTMTAGLAAGVPVFVAKEITGLWQAAGLPDLHFTLMSCVIAVAAVLLYVAISLVTSARADLGATLWVRSASSPGPAGPPLGDWRWQAAGVLALTAGAIGWLL